MTFLLNGDRTESLDSMKTLILNLTFGGLMFDMLPDTFLVVPYNSGDVCCFHNIVRLLQLWSSTNIALRGYFNVCLYVFPLRTDLLPQHCIKSSYFGC